jgi:hypothetical protein
VQLQFVAVPEPAQAEAFRRDVARDRLEVRQRRFQNRRALPGPELHEYAFARARMQQLLGVASDLVIRGAQGRFDVADGETQLRGFLLDDHVRGDGACR